MFKKIHSNVDPDATVAREIRREFTHYFEKAEKSGTNFISCYPKQIFMGMIFLIVSSAIICFLVFTPERRKKSLPVKSEDTVNVQQSISAGLGDILEIGSKVKNVYELKEEVQRVLAKPVLSKEDSAFLEKAITQLEIDQKPIKAKP